MAPKKSIYFFAELGKMMNMIRTITTELNEESGMDRDTKAAWYAIWYARDYAIAVLHANLQQLESEIAYFFTDQGFRKAIDNRLNVSAMRQKFVEEFRLLTGEYFNIKADCQVKKQAADFGEAAEKIYQVDAQSLMLLN